MSRKRLTGDDIPVGTRFANWATLSVPHLSPGYIASHVYARCLGCGRKQLVSVANLKNGNSKSCSMCGIKRTADAHRTHGLTRHPLFATWRHMMGRCYDPDHAAYRNNGGRGIGVCAEWHDPNRFVRDIESAIGPRPVNPDGWDSRRPYWTLDRTDNDSDYEPGNIRWATPAEQTSNRRS